MAFCDVMMPSQSERFTKDSNVISSKLANDLDSKLTSSSKQVLLQRIDFKAASKPDEQYEKLKSKYKALNQSSVSNGKTEKNCNQVNNGKKHDDRPEPRVVLCTPDNIMLQWNKVRRVGPGLSNLGNTCYLNSVIQVLSYTAPLVNFLSTQDHTNECRAVGFCMMCELQRHVLRSFNHHQNESIKPLAIIQKLRCIAKHLRFGHQEDAHEFLRYVIDGMQKSCLHGYEKLDKASKETTVIHKIFSGYYRSQVRCLMCHNTSNTFDPLMEVMLDIKQSPTIVRALQRLCKAELLDGDNLYYCLKCKKKVPAHKQVLIHQTPNILTVQLKRFDSNHIFGGKVTKPVDYKEYLDLRPFMTTPKGPPVKYKLYAVLVHSGYSSNSGHYYCYVRSSNNSWYNMNDSTVRQVGLNAALSQQAYLLFYSKVCDNTSPQEKKPFSPISIKPSNNSPAQHLPKIIKENDFGTPVSRNGLQQSKSPTSNTVTATKTKPTTPSHPSPSIIPATKTKPTTPSHPSPSIIPADQRPKLSFTLKSPTKFGKIKIEQKTPQDLQTKDESTKKHSGKQPTTNEKNDAPEKSDSKLEKPAKISAKSETEGKSTNSQDLKPPEPVEVSFPVKKDEKIPSPSKSVRPPPLFIPRIVQAKSSSNDAKSDGEKDVSMTSPAQATTPWKITPIPQFSMMSPPPKGAPLPQPSPSSVVSDGSSTSSVTAKTGEWAVKDKNVPTPGPILPERQHAGWTVSEKSGTETTDNNEEDWVEVTNDTNKKSKKKRKKEKQKKETMNYDKLDESTTSEAAENNVEEDKEDDSKQNKNQRKQKKKKRRKEKKKKDSDREELLKRKSSEEDLSSSEDKPQKRKKADGDQEVNFKKQRLVEYSSNDSSECGDDHNNNRKQKNYKHSDKEPSKNNKKAVPVVVFDGNPQDKQSRKATWDGSRDSSTVNKLLNSGGGVFGYGSNVSTWEGGDSMVNDVADKNERKRKVSRDSWDEELDKGKVKKVKDKNKQEKLSSGANFFQREQDKRNKKGSVVDKFTSHFSRRQSSHHSRSHTGRPYRRF